jgi:hypothetical protein
LLASVAVSRLVGCGGIASDAPADVERAPVFDRAWEDYRDRARAAAGSADHYLVEWDLVFATQEALREHYERYVALTPKLAVFKQRSTGFEPTYPRTDARDIEYCISNGFIDKATVVADMAAAARAWQDAADLQFRYVPEQDATCTRNNTSVDFTVLPTNTFLYTACAVNRLLWEGGPRCFVSINPVVGVLQIDYNRIPGESPDDALTPRGVLQHELGHILGFRHEHAWAPEQGGCGEGPDVPSSDLSGRRLTDEYDPDGWDRDSVMQYPRCNGRAGFDFSLSELDRTGARSVYGMPLSWYPAALMPLAGE